MMAGMFRFTRVAMLAAVVVATSASAARMKFAWLYDTETLPQRGVELETWIQEENVPGNQTTLFWLAPVVGITDRLELAIPIAMELGVTPTATTFGIDRFGAELRIKLTNPDPVEGGPFNALIRAGAFRLATERGMARLELGFVMSIDVGRVRMSLDAEGNVRVGDQPFEAELEPAIGLTVRCVDEFRLGVEAASSLELLGENPGRWVAVGPDLSWTYGRFWVSAAFLVGVMGVYTAPRINFGIAF
jgi:hypothetical protein